MTAPFALVDAFDRIAVELLDRKPLPRPEPIELRVVGLSYGVWGNCANCGVDRAGCDCEDPA